MKSRIFLVAILILLLVPFANATDIPGYIILGGSSSRQVHVYLHYPPEGTSSYHYDTDPGDVIVYSIFDPWHTEGSTTYFTYTKNSGETITGTIILDIGALGPLSPAGTQVASINGGTSTVPDTYLRIPLAGAYYPTDYQSFFFKANGTDTFYFVITTEASNQLSGKEGPFDYQTNLVWVSWVLDTDRDAYINVTGFPSDDPFVSASHSNPSGGEFIPYHGVTSIDNFRISEGGVGTDIGIEESVWEMLAQGLSDIFSAVKQIAAYALGLGVLFFSFATFILSIQIFVGFNVLYLAFAVLLSIEDSDDIFKTFGSIVRRMMKLWRFYMQIFKWIKTIIKWW